MSLLLIQNLVQASAAADRWMRRLPVSAMTVQSDLSEVCNFFRSPCCHLGSLLALSGAKANLVAKDEPVTNVLFIGQKPETVDFSDPALPPGLDAAKINAGIATAIEAVQARGWQVDLCLISPDDIGILQIGGQLRSRPYDCVLIGARLRVPPKRMILFERVINAVHATAPGAAIAFNTRPEDSAEAVARQLAPATIIEVESPNLNFQATMRDV
ncbi:hypothetical protein [Stenotrophomonas chelatiphaga]|uniref:hypothetical protein n=1 Tax=Stenotrophomonas chelatiphaga TaxID=517011 RepID=UPI002898378F|nr:hypothetical protein [Stenotrophomonas chelatiphaga]